MSFDLDALRAATCRPGAVARVVVADTRGSTPRPPGTAMLVWASGQEGTIGGGALEHAATAAAREALATGSPARPVLSRHPLGPALGQCCGGAVWLVTEIWSSGDVQRIDPERPLVRRIEGNAPMPLALARAVRRARSEGATLGARLVEGWLAEDISRPDRDIWIWGAGHVGRALAEILAPLPGLAVTWVDTAPARFPDRLPRGVTRRIDPAPETLAPQAPSGAEHLIVTFSHALDLALCHALLARGFAGCGLIGSATKWARFRHRLAALGHSPAAIDRIRCPIGVPALGKHPQQIAIGVAHALLSEGAIASVPRAEAAR